MQQELGQERRNTVFLRASFQANLRRFSAFANLEKGNDLVNRTVFATSTYNTTTLGATARLGKNWSCTAEAFRNNLNMLLNPESIFVLGGQGVWVGSTLDTFNQWSVFFRVSKTLTVGRRHCRPPPMDRFVAENVPLFGTVEGFVRQEARDGPRPAEGVSVTLDRGRSTATDKEGRFRFAEVAEGAHRVGLGENLSAELTLARRRN